MNLPVEVFSGMAHAIDAVIGGEVLLDGVLQCNMVLLCQGRAPTKGTADQPYSSLTIHFHTSDPCKSHILQFQEAGVWVVCATCTPEQYNGWGMNIKIILWPSKQ